jgi:hypothetical protein
MTAVLMDCIVRLTKLLRDSLFMKSLFHSWMISVGVLIQESFQGEGSLYHQDTVKHVVLTTPWQPNWLHVQEQ